MTPFSKNSDQSSRLLQRLEKLQLGKTTTKMPDFEQEEKFMKMAIEKAHLSDKVSSAYCVGCVIVKDNNIISTGYSRELPGNTHAEECALMKLSEKGESVRDADMYTTMEPCSKRLSGNVPCTERCIQAGIQRIVVGVREPTKFVEKCQGIEILQQAGIQVHYLSGLEQLCLAPNSHLNL